MARCLICPLLVVLGIAAWGVPSLGRQISPVKVSNLTFSHARHLKSLELACTDCHTSAASSRQASDSLLPGKQVCSSCHELKAEDSCTTCHPLAAAPTTLEIPERRLHFSHASHVVLSGLPLVILDAIAEERYPASKRGSLAKSISPGLICTGCHRGLEEADLGSSAHYPQMSDCMVCHTAKGNAMAGCATCHTDRDLLPASHRNDTFYDGHSSDETKHDLPLCRQCHTPGHNPCSQCH